MTLMTQTTMKAVVINKFGGMETLQTQTRPIPDLGPDQILIRIESAGVGQWDPFEREGGFAKMFGVVPVFPYVLGSDGAGTVEAVGQRVKRFKEGDRVYSLSFMNPKGGFYAQYAAVNAEDASLVPQNLTTEQAGPMPVDAITALRGLDDNLHLKKDESIMIFGASGGIGHLALQLAKLMGARVLAVASGADGVALARDLGADAAIDGHKEDVVSAARKFAREGLDAALITAGGQVADKALTALRRGGRVAYPNGVEPVPNAPDGVTIQSYDGVADQQAFEQLNSLIKSGQFTVHIARTFTLDQVTEAHRMLDTHYLGKLALRP